MTDKQQVLDALQPMSPGLAGGFAVKELTVQEFSEFAVVRYLAGEWQSVFGQKLGTKYRITHTFSARWRELEAGGLARFGRDAGSAGAGGFERRVAESRADVSVAVGWVAVHRRGARWEALRRARYEAFKPLIPLAPDVFALSGSLGEWMFVTGANGRATRIVAIRKTQALVWTRVESKPGARSR